MPHTAAAFEFCQYVHSDGRRCVLSFTHEGDHHVQPQSSVSVQAINRREDAIKKLGDKPVTGETVVAAIDEAVASDLKDVRARQAAVFGVVPNTFHADTVLASPDVPKQAVAEPDSLPSGFTGV